MRTQIEVNEDIQMFVRKSNAMTLDFCIYLKLIIRFIAAILYKYISVYNKDLMNY